ncbi:hypothetical protein U1Q18_011432, partial [Sarracenia purpurea var. burkii]
DLRSCRCSISPSSVSLHLDVAHRPSRSPPGSKIDQSFREPFNLYQGFFGVRVWTAELLGSDVGGGGIVF